MNLNEQIKKCNELKRKYLIEVLTMPHFYGTNKSRLFYFNGDCQVARMNKTMCYIPAIKLNKYSCN